MKPLKVVGFLCLVLFSTHLIGKSYKATEPVRDLKKLFDHKQHEAAFKLKNFDCVSCHPMGKILSDSELKRVTNLKDQSCHQCHNSSQEMEGSPKRCQTCHINVPQDKRHILKMWGDKHHGLAATQNSKDCERCHQPQTCAECHSGQGALKRDMHSRGFIFSHAIKARMNSQSCESCHQASFCIACHQKEKGK